MAHGFDWSEGTGEKHKNGSKLLPEGGSKSGQGKLLELVDLQKLEC